MLRVFKLIAFLEGISYLLLFANMLLLKPTFFEVYKQLLYPIGMSHGVLFMGYIGFAILLKRIMQWNFTSFFIILLASLLPFGTFLIDKYYLRNK
jgi:integral membrane protein